MAYGYILVGLGILCGALMAAQGAINGHLADGIGGPIQAALISFAVGSAVLLAANLILGHSVPSAEQAAALPWWAWVGGILGATVLGSYLRRLGLLALGGGVSCAHGLESGLPDLRKA